MKKLAFLFFKEAMDFQSAKAQLIKLGNVNNPIKIWLPLSQIEIRDSIEDTKMNLIVLPEWLVLKNSELMDYTDIAEYDEELTY